MESNIEVLQPKQQIARYTVYLSVAFRNKLPWPVYFPPFLISNAANMSEFYTAPGVQCEEPVSVHSTPGVETQSVFEYLLLNKMWKPSPVRFLTVPFPLGEKGRGEGGHADRRCRVKHRHCLLGVRFYSGTIPSCHFIVRPYRGFINITRDAVFRFYVTGE